MTDQWGNNVNELPERGFPGAAEKADNRILIMIEWVPVAGESSRDARVGLYGLYTDTGMLEDSPARDTPV